jgi:hypothetical protein
MRSVYRSAPVLLALSVAATGCNPSPPEDAARPDLPRVTLEVKGMT